MKPRYELYLKDIILYIKKIFDFTSDMDHEKFQSDEKTILAVIRCLEIIGESVNQIPKRLLDDHPDIPWDQIKEMSLFISTGVWILI